MTKSALNMYLVFSGVNTRFFRICIQEWNYLVTPVFHLLKNDDTITQYLKLEDRAEDVC